MKDEKRYNLQEKLVDRIISARAQTMTDLYHIIANAGLSFYFIETNRYNLTIPTGEYVRKEFSIVKTYNFDYNLISDIRFVKEDFMILPNDRRYLIFIQESNDDLEKRVKLVEAECESKLQARSQTCFQKLKSKFK
jgi:hypothetical protein